MFVPRQEYAFPARNSAAAAAPWSFNPDIASAPMLPEVSEEPYYRQYRSMSLSFGQPDLFSPSTSSANQFLNTIMQEDDEEEEEYRFERTRSKSSAAIMDIWNTPLSTEVEDAKWLAVHHRTTTRSLFTPTDTATSERRFSLAPSISLLERFAVKKEKKNA